MRAETGKNAARVDFVIVGTQKGGTTALDYYLRQNPGVQMANRKKEIHFFDNDSLDWHKPDYEAYHSEFDWSSQACVRGEVTPAYMYWPQSIERMRAYNPDMKLVCLLRNPAFRAYSHWRMERARGLEPLGFSHAIREGRKRIITHPESLRVHDYVERGLYHHQVVRLLENFDRGQILFLTSDELRESYVQVLHQLANFIGAEPFSNVAQRFVLPVEDRTPYDLAPEDVVFLTELFRDDILQTMELTGLELTAWLDPGYTEFKIRSAS